MNHFALLIFGATVATAERSLEQQLLLEDEDLALEEAMEAPTMGGFLDIVRRRQSVRRRPPIVKKDGVQWGNKDRRRRGDTTRRIAGQYVPEDVVFGPCYELGNKLTTMISDTMKLLLQRGTQNDNQIGNIISKIYTWCSEESSFNDYGVTQCKAYVGLVHKLYQERAQLYLPEEMLLSAYGDKMNQKQGCGVVINVINKKIIEGEIPGLSVVPVAAKNAPYEAAIGAEDEVISVVVAEKQSQTFAPVGAGFAFMIGAAYYAFEMCHDYEMISV